MKVEHFKYNQLLLNMLLLFCFLFFAVYCNLRAQVR